MRDTKSHSDDAVSPVIGVILMVAITVILAAVVGVFVLGIGDDVSEPAQIGLTFTEEGNQVTVQVISEGNVNSDLTVKHNSGNTTTLAPDAGESVTVTHGGSEVTVVGTVDGEDTVVGTFEP